MTYTFGTECLGPFDEVVAKVEAALADEGFGILSRIDVQATLKAKIDHDMPPYIILGACNPPFAKEALSVDPRVGTLLPCNVVVRGQGNGAFRVDFMDPVTVLQGVAVEDIEYIAAEVKARLLRVCAAVA